MEATEVGASADPDEVRWVSGSEAFALLSYERDKGVLAEALDVLGG